MANGDEKFYEELTRLNNELANTQRDLFKKNAELEALNEQKNRLIGMAAHDLRNPLGIMYTSSQYLMEATELTDEQLEFVMLINESSKSMLALVNDLLDLSAIESGKVELNFSKYNLNDVVKDAVKIGRIIAMRKNISINYGSAANELPVDMDVHKIRQVLDNLISNAIKFSYPNGAVDIKVSEKGGFVIVCVSDAGIGIAQDELHKLFIPFSRTSAQSTAGESNTGLGLAICKKIVESHKGKIWAESVKGKGSSFYFTIPLCGQDAHNPM